MSKTRKSKSSSPNTPGRVRAVHGYANVRKFLELATLDELRKFQKELEGDKELLKGFAQAETREGPAPKPQATGKSFFMLLERVVDGRSSRERVIEAWEDLSGRLMGSGPFIGGIWNALPADYKSRRVLSGSKHRPKPLSMMRGGGGGRGRGSGTRRNKPVAGFAVVHSAEKPWVKERNYQRWLGKLKRHTQKVKRHGEDAHPMNMCVDSKLCKGDLGIPRKLMPQFNSPRDIRSFVNFIRRHYGIKSVRGTRRAGELRPSQEEINRERVEDVKEDIVAKKLNPNVPLIVSSDGYVIDGHHRWAAYKSHQPSKKMPVLIVKDSARDVLSMAATWGAKHHQF